MECIAKARLLSFLGCQSLGRLQVEVWRREKQGELIGAAKQKEDAFLISKRWEFLRQSNINQPIDPPPATYQVK